MEPSQRIQGQARIQDTVLEQDLCTNCTACVNLCPYLKYYRDYTVMLYNCDKASGRCHQYCPRTPTDLTALRSSLFAEVDMTPEIGAFKGLYMTRATDEKIRAKAQHGGTVTALMALALDEGIIDAAVLAGGDEKFLTYSTVVDASVDVAANAGSQFVAAPTLAMFNETSQGDADKIGVVTTPCQALALAKMRVNAPDTDQKRVKKLKLVIGLFCGWALDWRKLVQLMKDKIGDVAIKRIDIPPSKYASMEVYTDSGTLEIPIEEVNDCVRDDCRYCFDMTCEFSDISVGSARSPEGWEVDRKWNQVIIRSALGEKLMEHARSRNILEFKTVPAGNIEKLKAASMNKKKNCVKHLSEKTGSPDDLVYLDPNDPMLLSLE